MKVWPVIHVFLPDIAVENARLAQQYGAAGVMLISMVGYDDGVDLCATLLRIQFPDLKIGVNYLTLPPRVALVRSLKNGYAATWTDHQRVDGHVGAPGHQFFVGVAFKGQRLEPDPARAALHAIKLGMIPTTSGERTGVPPEVEKLRLIRTLLHPTDRLALASGATPENISSFKPYLTDVLVATGISDELDRFDEAKLAAFMSAASE